MNFKTGTVFTYCGIYNINNQQYKITANSYAGDYRFYSLRVISPKYDFDILYVLKRKLYDYFSHEVIKIIYSDDNKVCKNK